MVNLRMRKTMKRNKIKKHKYSRKDKKTMKQKRHHKGGKYSNTLRGGDVCLKEVTKDPEVNRIGDENSNLAKKTSWSFGSLFGNNKRETTPIETTPIKENKIIDEKITDDIKNPLLSSKTEETIIVPPPPGPGDTESVMPPPQPAPEAGQTVVDERLAPYITRRNMGVPEPAIRSQMQANGFTQAQIDGVLAPDLSASARRRPPPPPPASLQVPTQSDNRPPQPLPPPGRPQAEQHVVDQRLAPYIKLRTMGTPDGAIRGRMQVNGFTQAEIDGLLGPDLSASAPSEPYRRPPPPQRTLDPVAAAERAKSEDIRDQLREALDARRNLIFDKNPEEDIDNRWSDSEDEDEDTNNTRSNSKGGKSRRRRRKMKSSRKKRKTTRK
jgi:hypothetical protein